METWARASMIALTLFALACEPPHRAQPTTEPTSPDGVPPMPVPVIETHEVLEPAPPTLDDDDLVEEADEADEATRHVASGAREIHPHGGMSDCLEMYSACAPDPAGTRHCTSAPLLLACGQTGTIPGGDTLVCVCP